MPLPDESGRGQTGAALPQEPAAVINAAVRRTEGVSAAVIRELMRRIAQSNDRAQRRQIGHLADIDEAPNDMLFAGGRLNVKLLGGAQQMAWA